MHELLYGGGCNYYCHKVEDMLLSDLSKVEIFELVTKKPVFYWETPYAVLRFMWHNFFLWRQKPFTLYTFMYELN